MALPSAATTLTPVAGYIPTQTRKVWFVPTIASTSAPTSVELSAGTDLTNQIATMAGFSGTGNQIDQPNMGTRWTPKTAGMITANDSTITFNMSKTSVDARTLFNDGSDGSTQTTGYICIFYEGVVTGGKMKVFPIAVNSITPSPDPVTVATFDVTFSIVTPPSAFIAVPTA